MSLPLSTIILPDELNEAVKTAIAEVKDGYAQTYLRSIEKAILHGIQIGRTSKKAVQVQLLYILSNLQTWRGENARECKPSLRSMKKNGEMSRVDFNLSYYIINYQK